MFVDFWNSVGNQYSGLSILLLWLVIFTIIISIKWGNKVFVKKIAQTYLLFTAFPVVPLILMFVLIDPLLVLCTLLFLSTLCLLWEVVDKVFK